MSPRTRIIENSKKPAIGGGRIQSVPFGPSMSRSSAREASPSRTVRASASRMPHARAAARAVTGRIGSFATSAASRSLNSRRRIRNRSSDGGAPCGSRFSRSASAP